MNYISCCRVSELCELYHLHTLENILQHRRAVGIVIRGRYELLYVWGSSFPCSVKGAHNVRYEQTRVVLICRGCVRVLLSCAQLHCTHEMCAQLQCIIEMCAQLHCIQEYCA